MADLVVIVPSRGRPTSARALIAHFVNTCTADTELLFAVDDDDPTADEYSTAVREVSAAARVHGSSRFRASVCMAPVPSNMVKALNGAAEVFTEMSAPTPYAVGFMGDDHCPRTHGWDQAYLDALHEMGTGIVYGNDLLQRERIPTQCAMTTDIVRALGYMAPPGLTHMYVDNAWLALGQAADCIRYLPDVIVEHMHPVAGKAQWDDGYRRVNAQEMYDKDQAEMERWVREELPGAAAKVKALR